MNNNFMHFRLRRLWVQGILWSHVYVIVDRSDSTTCIISLNAVGGSSFLFQRYYARLFNKEWMQSKGKFIHECVFIATCT